MQCLQGNAPGARCSGLEATSRSRKPCIETIVLKEAPRLHSRWVFPSFLTSCFSSVPLPLRNTLFFFSARVQSTDCVILSMAPLILTLVYASLAAAACPYAGGDLQARADASSPNAPTESFLSSFELNDDNSYLTSDVGGPIEDQQSLSAGERGPTLLEDFIFRQKIQRFDHERVCVHL